MGNTAPDRPLALVARTLITVAWTAVPDHVEGRAAQRLTRAAIVAASAAAYSLTSEARSAPWVDAEEDAQDAVDAVAASGPGQVALVVGGVLAMPAAVMAGTRVERAAVRALERRGVRHPWTWVGVGWGLVGLARPVAEAVRGRVSPGAP